MSPTPATSTRPLHVQATVLTSRTVGAYTHLTLVAPGIAERMRPGTFVAISTEGHRLARRAFWIHRVRQAGGHGMTLEVVVEQLGPGSSWLAAQPAGAPLAVTGPLGRPFALPKAGDGQVSCVLVGEGHGAAPMFLLAERLRERGCIVTMLVAGSDEAHLLSALEARRSARAVTVVTADGSIGLRGEVAEHIADVLRRADADVVYAAGPNPTLQAVAEAAEVHGAWSQVALEQSLTCATGLCQGCPLPVVGEDGVSRTVRACFEGPVVRGDRVRWDALSPLTAGIVEGGAG